MTTFVHVDQPVSHPGVRRAEATAAYFRDASRSFKTRGGAVMMVVAALLAAALVVAERFVAEITDGSLLAAWVVLWALVFGALSLYAAGAAQNLAIGLVERWNSLQRAQAAARADERFLAAAHRDTRIMNDLQAAITRAESVSAVDSAVPAQTKMRVHQATASHIARYY
ncbi:hypothetical protein [Pseudacidovorax sp. RU35E]|uniref:hypothetical protein n=1 Tax=Pseudacidovorax sp. RU35E TaxID=1907403 RepID=UPI000955904D|nr:hypothetical protein [Pseudacidovorax sp. RU35E]SIQ35412.1 hypothetical protein SAMN05880557_103196 [Pseudacidovorax sp. RU35E]